jgi:alcohol dehydrogenase (cytochrome c)
MAMKNLAVCALTFLPAGWAQLSYERIRDAASEPGNWLTYSGSYSSQRFSKLSEINAKNAHLLKPVWVYQARDTNKFEATPLAVDGVLYVSEPSNYVTAVDARTGRPLWEFRHELPRDLRLCCGQINRGLAMLGHTLFFGTLDAHLIALDARTGRMKWKIRVEDYTHGYSITAAPLALADRIIVGVAGGEFGVRGFIDAYDPHSGKRLWRFYTVPGPGEPGNETWKGDSWKTGAATTWLTGSYDPELNLLYWGTGNPGPDYDGAYRSGDNLYSASVVALDPGSGKRRWHFQFTPHDVHDWDANQIPVLADLNFRGRARKLLLWANRNGFYYVLDRTTGEFLHGRAFGKQTWAKGLDDRGRPIRIPNTSPPKGGEIPIYPGVHGVTNWFSPSFSPMLNLFYVSTREEGSHFYAEDGNYRRGEWFSAGGIRGIEGVEPGGSIQALDALTGERKWVFPMQAPPWCGVLSTAGGVVFGGSVEGYFLVLDAQTGKLLYRFPGGGAIFGNPVTFEVAGKQHVVIAAGNALFAFRL